MRTAGRVVGRGHDTSAGRVRALFVMEQHLGHETYYMNLKSGLEGAPGVEAEWAPVSYAPSGLPWERIGGLPPSVRGALRGRAEVLRALAAVKPEVCFFNTQVPAVLAGRRARRRPYVVATDVTPLQYDRMAYQYGHRPDRGGPMGWFKRWSTAITLRGAVRVLPWSTWAAQSLIEDYGVDAKRVVVLPPGVNLDRWRPGRPGDGGRVRILFVGGDFGRKGGATLLEAFRGLDHGLAELMVVTRTDLPSQPNVSVFKGLGPNSSELLRLFQGCDLFVLPTVAEAFGIVAVEAAAAGLPVVASSVGGLGDIVIPGTTGLLVPPGDAIALRAAMLELIRSPERRRLMGEAARRRAESHFDARRNAEVVASVLAAAARTRGSEE